MPKEFYRREEHYEEAIKGEDRPVWNEKKAQRMISNWRSSAEKFADIDDYVATVMTKHDIIGPLRSVYYSFARRAYSGFIKNKISSRGLDNLADFWVKQYKADRKILNEIIGFIRKRYGVGK